MNPVKLLALLLAAAIAACLVAAPLGQCESHSSISFGNGDGSGVSYSSQTITYSNGTKTHDETVYRGEQFS